MGGLRFHMPPISSILSLLLPVFGRRYADRFQENLGKMPAGTELQAVRDLLDRQLTVEEQILCPFHTHSADIIRQ